MGRWKKEEEEAPPPNWPMPETSTPRHPHTTSTNDNNVSFFVYGMDPVVKKTPSINYYQASPILTNFKLGQPNFKKMTIFNHKRASRRTIMLLSAVCPQNQMKVYVSKKPLFGMRAKEEWNNPKADRPDPIQAQHLISSHRVGK